MSFDGRVIEGLRKRDVVDPDRFERVWSARTKDGSEPKDRQPVNVLRELEDRGLRAQRRM